MYSSVALTFFAIFGLSTAQTPQNITGPLHGKLVVCPVANDGLTSLFFIERADLNLCTHLICLGANTSSTEIDEIRDRPDFARESYYRRLTNLRQKYPHLKVSFSIHYKIAKYLKIANETYRQKEFIENVKDFVLKHNFNGLNLEFNDLEESQIPPLDFYKIVLLVKNLKVKFKFVKSNLLLTTSFSVSKDVHITDYELGSMSKYVDFMSFMQIYTDPSTEYLTINQAISARASYNIESGIINLIKSGIPSTKLAIGIQFGGPELFTTLNANDRASKFNGIIGYNSICNLLSNATLRWEKLYFNGLILLKNLDEKWVIVYESSRSIANKMQFVVKYNLTGVSISAINMDDFMGKCKIDEDTFTDFKITKENPMDIKEKNSTSFSLLRTINEAINTLIDETTNHSNFENVTEKIPISDSEQNPNLDKKEVGTEDQTKRIETVDQTEEIGTVDQTEGIETENQTEEIRTEDQTEEIRTEDKTESQTEAQSEPQPEVEIQTSTENATETQAQTEIYSENENQTTFNDNETNAAFKIMLIKNVVVFVVAISMLSSILFI